MVTWEGKNSVPPLPTDLCVVKWTVTQKLQAWTSSSVRGERAGSRRENSTQYQGLSLVRNSRVLGRMNQLSITA